MHNNELTVTRVNTRNPLFVLVGTSRNTERGRVQARGRLNEHLLGTDRVVGAVSRINLENEFTSTDIVGDVELNGESEFVT